MNKIYCFWTGTNEMSIARLKGLDKLRCTSECEVILVTPENLNEFISKPIHPAYEYLSLVHRSDYLRAYFMHYIGGGYSDIKPGIHSWRNAFESLEKYSVIGYKEVGSGAVAQCFNKPGMRKKLQDNWRLLVGCGAFICNPNTEFTQEWLDEVNKLLTYNLNLLKKHPGNILGDNEGYPLNWTELLGDIFHPLVLKHRNEILQNDFIKPDFTKIYR